MPNHVTTEVRAPREVLEGLTRTATQDEIEANREEQLEWQRRMMEKGREVELELTDPERRFVDFGLVIPEPENIETGGCGGDTDADGRHANGEVCWYRWNLNNWGTKWNAYSSEVDLDEGLVRFDSAWSHPYPVLVALTQKFPEHEISVRYADEDLGQNCGAYTVLNVEMIEDNTPDYGSPEAYELACQVKYGRSFAEMKVQWDAEEMEYLLLHHGRLVMAEEQGVDVGNLAEMRALMVAWRELTDEERAVFIEKGRPAAEKANQERLAEEEEI